ncbi:MAG: DEAD/DEAH box helicase [Candidatus Doudnabacteria bacterium]|nr:DEAD/DEAH box helicase [Candidatus Doudnabacteria bacterium]
MPEHDMHDPTAHAANEDPTTFEEMDISPKLKAILAEKGFTTPTPIQAQAIPSGLSGTDMIGIAQTGTGKTLAFSIPTIQRIGKDGGKGLILLPTRELALQVDEELQKIGGKIGLRTAVLIGGANMGRQKDMIRKNPHIIIATPGRLIDHLEQRSIKLDSVSVLVFDEADRMLDMGFAPQINRILEMVPSPEQRQTLLFSATMPEEITRIAETHMRLPVRIEIARAGTTSENVEQELYVVAKTDKQQLLEELLREYQGSVLVFSRTKHGAKRINRKLRDAGFTSDEIHGNRTLGQRKSALSGFKSGKYRVLVATDIAARGIDVKGIELVINFDLPTQAEDYVHRIGRTGRAGHEGRAISFAMPDEGKEVMAIQRVTQAELPITEHPTLPKHHLHRGARGSKGRGGGRGGRGGRNRGGGRGRSGGGRRRW